MSSQYAYIALMAGVLGDCGALDGEAPFGDLPGLRASAAMGLSGRLEFDSSNHGLC